MLLATPKNVIRRNWAFATNSDFESLKLKGLHNHFGKILRLENLSLRWILNTFDDKMGKSL